MSRYLEDAAALLRKAADTNESEYKLSPALLNKGRERIARLYVDLAAIDSGQLPASVVDMLLARIAEQDR